MKSNITGGETKFLFKGKILNKYEISYFQCEETGYIQSEKPYWLDEAYSSAITKLDIGLIKRNLYFSDVVEKLIRGNFNPKSVFLDYSGGYGLFTRLMRDKGFDYWNTDKYCQNLFAEYNDLEYFEKEQKFNLATAFEVFEHFEDPANQLHEPLSYSDNLLFSTELIPDDIKDLKSWWYFAFETGQHVSFYTLKSLEYLAQKNNKHFYSNGKNLHLFSSEKHKHNPFKIVDEKKLPFVIRKMKKLVASFEKNRFSSFQNNSKSISSVKMPNLFEYDNNEIKKRLNKKES